MAARVIKVRLTNQEFADVIVHTAARARRVRLTWSFGVCSARSAEWSAGSAVLIAGCAECHVAFGMLLCAFVTLRCMHHARDHYQNHGCSPQEFVRCMSRTIYLLLYGVLLLKLLMQLTSVSWHDAGVVWSWSPQFLAGPERAFVKCGERFRMELFWGVVALCLIRALIRRNSPPRRPELEAQS